MSIVSGVNNCISFAGNVSSLSDRIVSTVGFCIVSGGSNDIE